MNEVRIKAVMDPKRGLWQCEMWATAGEFDGKQKWRRLAKWTTYDFRHRHTDRQEVNHILAHLAG